MMQSTVSVRFVLAFLLLLLAHANKFDEDTGTECKFKAENHYCLKDPQTYFDCPETCAKHHRPEQFTKHAFERADVPPIFDFTVKDMNGKDVHFADFDGEITIVSVIPLHPGMAQFHYNLLDHLLEVHKYVLNVVVVPMEGTDGIEIIPKEGSGVHVLAEPDRGMLQYLVGKIQEGEFNSESLSSFIVDPTGKQITCLEWPDMKEYRKIIDDNLKSLVGKEL